MFEYNYFIGFRITGVLQRIAICYLIMSSSYLLCPKFYYNGILVICCIAIYLGFMYGYDVPGCGRGKLEDTCGENPYYYCNFEAYLDYKVFTEKYMFAYSDPEGKELKLLKLILYILYIYENSIK